MALARDIESYGGPYSDAYAVEDPTIEQSAALDNLALSDEAQMTRTTVKIRVRFPTTTTAGPIAVTPTAGVSHMGTGSAQLPTIQKTATGRYTITYPNDWTYLLGAISVTEPISFTCSSGRVSSLTVSGRAQTTVLGSVVYVAVFDAAALASDLTNGTMLEVEAS